MAARKAEIMQGIDQVTIWPCPLECQFHKVVDQKTAYAYYSNFHGPFPVFSDQVSKNKHTITNLQKNAGGKMGY